MLELLLVGLFVFVMGGMVLIAFLGAQGLEDRLMQEEGGQPQPSRAIAPAPQFLVVGQQATARFDGLDETFLPQLREYLEAEETLVSEFVMQPSLETLYRQSERRFTQH